MKFNLHSLLIFLLIVVGAIPLFTRLGAAPLYMWDEAIYANNAVDMYLNHDLFVIKRFGAIDLLNTKPPFVIWMEVICLHIFGVNEFAIRFPSASFSLLTVILLIIFSIRELKSITVGFASALTLVTTQGFVTNHVSRSGDLDATLVFWMTLYVLIWIRFLLNEEQRKPQLFFFCLALLFGFLSKGVAAFLFLPFLALVSLFFVKGRRLLMKPSLWIYGILTLLACMVYYAIRELKSPGYLKKVYESEILRVDNPVMSWHVQPFDFYFKTLATDHLKFYIWLLPFCLILVLFFGERRIRMTGILLLVITAGYLLWISAIKDKLGWYDAPLFPLLSLIAGMGIHVLIEKVDQLFFPIRIHVWKPVLITLIIGVVFFYPYKKILSKELTTDPLTYSWDSTQYDFFRMDGGFVKQLAEKFPAMKKYYFLKEPEEDNAHYNIIRFYQRTLDYNQGIKFTIVNNVQHLTYNDTVAVCNPSIKDTLSRNHVVDTIETWRGGLLCRLAAKK